MAQWHGPLLVLLSLFGGLTFDAHASLRPGRPIAEWDAECEYRFPDQELLNFEDLKAFIARKRVGSARELVAAMVGDPVFGPFLNSYVLMHTSRSAQQDAVDSNHPRVIFFHRGLLLGVTDHPQRPNSKVEVIQYNSAAARFEFKLIDFKARQPYQENPTSCRRCHGQTPLPIWTTYRNWPGAHNSAHSYFQVPDPRLLQLSKEELRQKRQRLAQLRQGWRQLTRAEEAEGRALWQLLHGTVDRARAGIYTHLGETGEGTSLLNEFLNNYNFRRILHELKASPEYERYRYAMGAALIECPDLPDFLGPRGTPHRDAQDRSWNGTTFADLKGEVRTEMTRQFNERLAYALSIKDPVASHETAMNDDGDIARLAGWRYLFEKRGVDVKRFSLNFAPGTAYGYGFSRVGAGGGGLRFGFCRFIPDLVRSDRDLAPLLDFEPIGSETEEEKAPRCALLKRKSLEALRPGAP